MWKMIIRIKKFCLQTYLAENIMDSNCKNDSLGFLTILSKFKNTMKKPTQFKIKSVFS